MEWNDLQLKFDLDLDEVAEDAADRSISAAEARLISEAARRAFEATDYGNGLATDYGNGLAKGDWLADYLKLREMGWPWRVAAYIAWASSPKAGRWPKNLAELADKVLGLRSTRAIHTWRDKYPAINTMVAVMQAAPLLEHKRDVIEALVAMASNPDYKTFNDRKLFLEMVGLYTPKSKLELENKSVRDLSELSDEELDELAGPSTTDGRMADKERLGEEREEEQIASQRTLAMTEGDKDD